MSKIESKAFFLTKVGTPEQAFELRTFQVDVPKENEVVIEVEAFGLNYSLLFLSEN